MRLHRISRRYTRILGAGTEVRFYKFFAKPVCPDRDYSPKPFSSMHTKILRFPSFFHSSCFRSCPSPIRSGVVSRFILPGFWMPIPLIPYVDEGWCFLSKVKAALVLLLRYRVDMISRVLLKMHRLARFLPKCWPIYKRSMNAHPPVEIDQNQNINLRRRRNSMLRPLSLGSS